MFSLASAYQEAGDFKKSEEIANKILNRNWSIYGKVQKGKQLGKKKYILRVLGHLVLNLHGGKNASSQ